MEIGGIRVKLYVKETEPDQLVQDFQYSDSKYSDLVKKYSHQQKQPNPYTLAALMEMNSPPDEEM